VRSCRHDGSTRDPAEAIRDLRIHNVRVHGTAEAIGQGPGWLTDGTIWQRRQTNIREPVTGYTDWHFRA